VPRPRFHPRADGRIRFSGLIPVTAFFAAQENEMLRKKRGRYVTTEPAIDSQFLAPAQAGRRAGPNRLLEAATPAFDAGSGSAQQDEAAARFAAAGPRDGPPEECAHDAEPFSRGGFVIQVASNKTAPPAAHGRASTGEVNPFLRFSSVRLTGGTKLISRGAAFRAFGAAPRHDIIRSLRAAFDGHGRGERLSSQRRIGLEFRFRDFFCILAARQDAGFRAIVEER
jgi:hypothetical protein